MDYSMMMDWGVGLLTLTALEIVLGIDNIVLLTILVSKLPKHQQPKARTIGLSIALLARVVFLSMAVWLTGLTDILFSAFGKDISTRDLVLILGGLFLLSKATTEIFNFVELKEHTHKPKETKGLFYNVIGQIVLFDIIFSFDSVLTAIGLSKNINVMIAAVVISIIFMMIFAAKIGQFVDANPSVKILALSFLVMIGMLLMAEGFGSHMDRGYVYFSMAFSLFIEFLNKRRHKKLSTR